MKPRKNKIPAFIPNQPRKINWLGTESGARDEAERKKQRENQKKLMLNNKNRKY